MFRRDCSFVLVKGTPDPETVERLFRHKVLRMLLQEGAIAESAGRNLPAWPHTGCGAHVSLEIPSDGKRLRAIARYMTRPPISPERMLGEARNAEVIYRSYAVRPRQQANFRSAETSSSSVETLVTKPRSSRPPHRSTQLSPAGWPARYPRG